MKGNRRGNGCSFKVVIVLGKCSKAISFSGFDSRKGHLWRLPLKKSSHFKKRDNAGLWRGTWAFSLKEDFRQARKDIDRDEIRGSKNLDAGYPGCPHCKKRSIVKCACGK